MKKSSLVIVTLIAFCGFSQTSIDYLKYDWADKFNPDDFTDTEMASDEEAIVVLDRTVLNYAYVTGGNALSISLNRTDHIVYRIQNESAIEKVNRIYLGSRNGFCTSIKVRTINSQGKVVEFDQDKLEEVKLDEGYSSYKILAIPGIETNSWVEVITHYERSPSSMRFLLNHPFNTRKAEVIVRRLEEKKLANLPPEDPVLKGFNGFERDPSAETEKLIVYKVANFQGNRTEKYMHEYSELPRLDFARKLATWGGQGDWLYNRIFNSQIIMKKKFSNSSLKKIFSEIGLDEDMSQVEKLRLIEKFVKENITLTESNEANFEDEDRVINSRVANDFGIYRVFRLLLIGADIEFDIYLVSDKEYIGLNREFPMSLGLDEVLFYFPLMDMYCLPDNRVYYAGKIPNFIGGCEGLGLFQTSIVSRIKEFPMGEKEYNYEGTFSTISFDLDEEISTIEKTKKFYGDRAIRSRGYLNYADESDKNEYLEDLLLSELEETTLTPITLTNESIDLNFNSKDTLYFSSTLTSEGLLTPISNGFLLEFPKVIGKQTSFYEENERIHDLFINRSIVYRHDIIVQIPDGYDLLDYENHKKSAVCKDSNGRIIATFTSDVRLEGQKLIIEIDEFHEEGSFPKDLVADYQKVINAAYEFYISTSRLVKKD